MTMKWSNGVLLLFAFVAYVSAQDFLHFLESCEPKRCPVDCSEQVAENNCPTCVCPRGFRCPIVNCPKNAHFGAQCRLVKTMDECETCLCDRPVFKLTNKQTNVENFLLRPPHVGAIEHCRLTDLDAIQKCLAPLDEFKATVHRRLPLLSDSFYPWMKVSKDEFKGFCQGLAKLPVCLGRRRWDRCLEQHKQLQALYTAFAYPCISHKQQFAASYECLYNVFASHLQVAQCDAELNRDINQAENGPYTVFRRAQLKCNALNTFVACTKPAIISHCGSDPARTFRDVFVNSGPLIAPECNVVGQYFEPKDLRESPEPKRSKAVEQAATTFVQQNTPILPPGVQSVEAPSPRIQPVANAANLPEDVAFGLPPSAALKIREQNDIIDEYDPENILAEVPAFVDDQLRRTLEELAVGKVRNHHLPVQLVTVRENGSVVFRKRCDPVSGLHRRRSICPGGEIAKSVTRWYREKGAIDCTPYQYGYCGEAEELNDLPIKFQQDCYDLCFKDNEKPINDLRRKQKQLVN